MRSAFLAFFGEIWSRCFSPPPHILCKLTLIFLDGSGPSPRTRSRIQAKIKREAAKDVVEQERLRDEGQGIVRRASLNTPARFLAMEAAAAAVPEVTEAAAADAGERRRLRLQAANGGEAEKVGGGAARAFSLETDGQPQLQTQTQTQRQRRRRGSGGSSGSAASNSTGRSQRISFATASD